MICCISHSFVISLLLHSECFCNLHHLNWPLLQNLTFPNTELDLVTTKFPSWRSGWFCTPSRQPSPESRVHDSCTVKWWANSEAAATVHITSSSALSSEMRKRLINSSVIHCMATSSSQGEQSYAANIKNYRSIILWIWIECRFQRILDFCIPNGWGSRVLSWYPMSYLASNINCILLTSSSNNLLHVFHTSEMPANNMREIFVFHYHSMNHKSDSHGTK